jgi:predicted metal-dependent peptidase
MEERLTQILVEVLLQEPFFGHLAANLLREIREDIEDTALVVQADGTIRLAVNPAFWRQADLSESERYGAVKHELLHLALLHPFRDREFPNATLYGIAADLVVNQYLPEDQLRSEQVRLNKLQTVSWEPNRSLGYYYRQLESMMAGLQGAGGADKALLEQWTDAEHPAQVRHRFWADALEDLEPEQQEALASMWQHQLKGLIAKEAAASFNRLDEPLRELIFRRLQERSSKVDWKRVLRMFATNSRRMLLKDTIRRPSKRYGTVPGVKIKRHQQLIIALDTSGSLPAILLGAFFREIHQLWRTGAEMTIVECDDQIRNQYPYRGQKVLEVAGRGMTAFDDPIRLANEKRVDGLIYLTDGLGPPPEVTPRVPMLWLISREGIRPDSRTWSALPGRVVKMN